MLVRLVLWAFFYSFSVLRTKELLLGDVPWNCQWQHGLNTVFKRATVIIGSDIQVRILLQIRQLLSEWWRYSVDLQCPRWQDSLSHWFRWRNLLLSCHIFCEWNALCCGSGYLHPRAQQANSKVRYVTLLHMWLDCELYLELATLHYGWTILL